MRAHLVGGPHRVHQLEVAIHSVGLGERARVRERSTRWVSPVSGLPVVGEDVIVVLIVVS